MKDLILRLWAKLLGSAREPLAAGQVLLTTEPASRQSLTDQASHWESDQIGVQTESPTGRPFGTEVPAEMRRMKGTKMYLTLGDLTDDQQRWYTEAEALWTEQVDFAEQDFHLLYEPEARRWVVRLGSKDGPELVVDPPFDLHKWGAAGQIIRRRLVHLFMDRNEIPGQLFVYRQRTGSLYETETVAAT